MIERDRQEFAETIAAVYEFYGKDISDSALEIWWNSMRSFELAAVRDALGRHAMNPDTGQFIPKPADVVKMLGGSTLDTALLAWTKVDQAVQRIGSYHTVVFDDALIHRVVEEMGGWVVLCKCSAKDWPFRQNEFVARYRSYRSRNERPPYPPKLVGIIDGENSSKGYDEGPPLMVGDVDLARAVLLGGSSVPMLAFTPMPLADAAALTAPAKALAKRSEV